jgi:hypothetical protein
MPADGLIKGLIKQKNNRFIEQLNLVDILTRLGPILVKDSKVAIESLETAIIEPTNSKRVYQTLYKAKALVAVLINS